MGVNKKYILMTFVLGLLLMAAYAYALDYPHTDEGLFDNDIYNCNDCHFDQGGHSPPTWYNPQLNTLDDTFYNQQCRSCHYTGGESPGPFKKPHSSNSMETTQYGNWRIQCWQCHDPHAQEQIDDDLADTTTPLSDNFRRLVFYAKIVSIVTDNTPGSEQSTITIDTDLNEFDPAADFSESLSPPRSFYEVVPNIAEPFYVYRIKTADPGVNLREIVTLGVIDTSKAGPNDDLRIYIAKLNRRVIDAPDIPTCTYEDHPTEGELFDCTNRIPKNVKWKNRNDHNSFADGDMDGDGNYTGMCEICHTRTKYHRNVLEGPVGVHEHNKQQDCMQCHDHEGGFAVNETACSVCHGFPPTENVPNQSSTGGNSGMVDQYGLIGSEVPGSTGSATPGAHDKHVNTEGFSCSTCHAGSAGTSTTHNSDLSITMGFSMFNGFFQGGNYDGQVSVTAGYNTAPVPTSPATTVSQGDTKQCSNIYCHSIVQTSTGAALTGAGGEYKQPVWDGAVVCGDCHDADSAPIISSGSHTMHADTQMFACDACHNYQLGTTQAADHPNGVIDIDFGLPRVRNASVGRRPCAG
jgi:predicted CxxxxCH...CXXCH cytochrome family protein